MKVFRYFTALGMFLGLCITPAAEAVVISTKSLGMAGVGIGYAQDAMAAANNPASAADIDDRFDLGVNLVHLSGHLKNYNSPVPGTNGSYNGYHSVKYFVSPDFGLNYNVNENVALGLVVYNRDLAKTTYSTNFALTGTSNAGLEYVNETISPYIAYRWGNHNFGVSFNWQIVRAKVNGFERFDNAVTSINPGSVTNRGYNYSNGLGYTFGWTWHITDDVTFGATYQPETQMSRLKKYSGFLAQGGKFNIARKVGAGISWRFIECATVAFDYEWIDYNRIKCLNNSLSLNTPPLAVFQNQLGSKHGPGFGWKSKNFYRLGVDYAWNEDWIFRAGYRYAKTQIRKTQTPLNALTLEPLVESIATVGATWTLSCRNEIDFWAGWGFNKRVRGSHAIPEYLGGGGANVSQKLWGIGLSWGHKF